MMAQFQIGELIMFRIVRLIAGGLLLVLLGVFGFSFLAFASNVARADTIFDVEHARANYRAGVASEYDEYLLNRWGRPSGYYPQYFDPPPRRRVYLRKQRAWGARR